jgi:hypothetical protein
MFGITSITIFIILCTSVIDILNENYTMEPSDLLRYKLLRYETHNDAPPPRKRNSPSEDRIS